MTWANTTKIKLWGKLALGDEVSDLDGPIRDAGPIPCGQRRQRSRL
jgi:hypothetical protein